MAQKVFCGMEKRGFLRKLKDCFVNVNYFVNFIKKTKFLFV
jgi:hypothetical protein